MQKVHDVRIKSLQKLPTPKDLEERLPITPKIAACVVETRQQIAQILSGEDQRLVIIVGPCSIHDQRAGLEYAKRLAELAQNLRDRLLIVMRVYFEKPRTTIGWKGLIYDPYLDGGLDIAKGLSKAREFLLQVGDLELPVGTEFLDPIIPQYIADLVSWAAIGARTSESQIHRQMASGLSMPIGFKNSTNGDAQIAVDAIIAARAPQGFFGIDHEGHASAVITSGNPYCHIILRGGRKGPNYNTSSVGKIISKLEKANVLPQILIDCSHDNSRRDHKRQPIVFREVLEQRVTGNTKIFGMMIESHLFEGNQRLGKDPSALRYGVSITDACINWEETQELLSEASQALLL